MRERYRVYSVLAMALMLAVILACNDTPTAPGAITIINTQTQGGGSGGPGASPSPGTGGTLPPGSTVRVGFYGFSGANCTMPNGARQLKQGCVGFATCTPKMPDGTDIPASVHGPDATWTVPFGSERVSVSRDSNPFNVDVRGLSVGTFRLECRVKDITGGADFEVIANTSGDASAMDGNLPPPYPPPPTLLEGPMPPYPPPPLTLDHIPPPGGSPPPMSPDGLPTPVATPHARPEGSK